jgi:hypothetical protein
MGYRLHDRRAAHRPANGDTAICPKCRVGIIEFNERYRVVLVTGKTVSIPAWVCDRPECRFERAARSGSDQIPLHNASADLRTRSTRPLMKARAVLHRARKTLSKSLRRKKNRH